MARGVGAKANNAPAATWEEVTCARDRSQFVRVVGDEFAIRLTPDMADNLAGQLTRCARLARAAEV